jgi:hypothetical protein
MTTDTNRDADLQKAKDELSAKLEHGADIVGDLIKVARAYGERGPKAVYVHTEQLSEDELRHTLTALIVFTSANNTGVVEMLAAREDDKPVLN